MNPREELVDLARTAGMPKARAERFTDEVLAAHAHELAEQIRAERGSGTYEPGVYFHGGMDYAADIIDPQKSAGSVRPDEEPTP